MSDGAPLWGVDLGGTKIEGAVLDPAHPGRALQRMRIPTEGDRGYDHVLGRVRALIEQLEAASQMPRPALIGIGTPGTEDPASGLLKNSNSTSLTAQPLRRDLEAVFWEFFNSPLAGSS